MATAIAMPAEPAEAALAFIDKVRGRSLNLDPGSDTALAPQTSAGKRREIARRLERLAADLGGDPLDVGPVRTDSELAGVLLRQTGDPDPARLRVMAVALIRRGDGWLPAPLPGSFENTGIRQSAALGTRAAALENWLLREQALELGRLREQSAARLRQRIESSLPADLLRSLDSHGVCRRFLDAVARRDVAAALGLLGGLSGQAPADWELRLKATRDALGSKELPRPWRLLGAPDVLRMEVEHDVTDADALASIACLDPHGSNPRAAVPRVEFVHLELVKTEDGMWRVDPPAGFFQQAAADDDDTIDEGDSELVARLGENLRAARLAKPQRSAGEIQRLTLDALQRASFPALVPWIFIDPATDDCTATLVRAAQDWRSLHESAGTRVLISHGMKETETAAAALWQVFSPGNPDRLDLRVFHFRKTADGWLWTPVASDDERREFGDWRMAEEERVQASWRQSLLAGSHELAEVPDAGPPTEEEARTLVEQWLETIANGDLLAAIRLTARLRTADSATRLLRNLGYEMTGMSRDNGQAARITGVRRGSLCALVAVHGASDGKDTQPLYPVLRTPAGPRILLEVDLFSGGGRSRDFLNKTSLEHLRGVSAPAARDLRQLLAQPQAEAPARREKRKPPGVTRRL